MNRPSVLLLYGLDHQTLPVDADDTRHTIQRAEQALRSRGWEVSSHNAGDDLESALRAFPPDRWLVFNLCEGSPHQACYYARVAQALEERGYAFTGSSAEALHETQFKPTMKRRLDAAGLPTPQWTAGDRADALQFGVFPAIVKPAAEHCSFGISRDSVVFNLAEARAQAKALMRQYQGGVILEEFLDSEEYSVSLLGNGTDLTVLGASVIRYDAFPDLRDRLCTFEAKWLPETAAYQQTLPTCPAPVSPQLQSELETLAQQAHLACGVRDYCRVDVRLKHGHPSVLDVNTNCDLAESGGFANTARVAGLDYPAMLERLALLAFERVRDGHPLLSTAPPVT